MTEPLSVFPSDNPYGKRTIPGMKALASDRRLRKIASGRVHYFHRAKNGVYDPMTFFYVVNALLEVVPGTVWKTAAFVAHLQWTCDQLTWDAVTVGRVLADIAESVNEKSGFKVLTPTRRWDGMYYDVNSNLETRAVLIRLLDDLIVLCDELREQESRGRAPVRLNTPLLKCPSL